MQSTAVCLASLQILYLMCYAIWYQLYNLNNVEKTNGRALLLVKLNACNFTKSNTPPWSFLRFYIVQLVQNRAKHHIWNTTSVNNL